MKKPLKAAAEVEKRFTCGFAGCGQTFANSGSARAHCRLKHIEWYKSLDTTLGVARFCTWDDPEQYREMNRNARAEGKKPLKAAAEVEKRFTCGFAGCGLTFASSDNARKHCRLKHNEWYKSLDTTLGVARFCTWDDSEQYREEMAAAQDKKRAREEES